MNDLLRNPEKRFGSVIFFLPTIIMLLSFASALAVDKTESSEAGTPWNPARSDQWTATDGLFRELPGIEEVGETRPDKYIACFYFLWNGRHGEAGPYNIEQILKEHPEAKDDPANPVWGGLGIPHHWSESIFGYYVGEDESVLRKHAQMLGDAGVDVICFDVTNQLTYPESYRPLFKVFSEMQREGNKVPKVAFLCPFWAPNKVVRELWRDVYSKNFYPDVWFYWKGKPLILADSDMLERSLNLNSENCDPIEIIDQTVLAQKFEVKEKFDRIFIDSPTWKETNSAVDFALLDNSGKVIERRKSIKVVDCVPFSVNFKRPIAPGIYTVALQKSGNGKVGWWSRKVAGDSYEEGAQKAFKVEGVRWLEATENGTPQNVVRMMNVGLGDDETTKILNFFTFRPSQPDYFIGPTKPNQWSWLEVYPQHEFYNDKGELEEMGVGVAQNAVEGKLGVLSNPNSYGRSFHNGSEPAPEDCDYTGRNFQEQWERALKTDPEIIFVTGWNEWIAGRFDKTAPFHGATPVSFVDQYNEEFSRDCEPMKGGHEDAYYYQMISNIRRFKGVSRPEPSVSKPIVIDGSFEDWNGVEPKYYDTVSDPVHRDCRGWGKGTRYVNETGRNDFVESRVSYDDKNVYFYVKTRDEIQGNLLSKTWISLLIDADNNARTGVKGNDYMAYSDGSSFMLYLTEDNGMEARTVEALDFKSSENEIEMAIPRNALGFSDKAPSFRFKWIDGIDPFGDWSEFTTNGDAAPNDRYYYQYFAPQN